MKCVVLAVLAVCVAGQGTQVITRLRPDNGTAWGPRQNSCMNPNSANGNPVVMGGCCKSGDTCCSESGGYRFITPSQPGQSGSLGYSAASGGFSPCSCLTSQGVGKPIVWGQCGKRDGSFCTDAQYENQTFLLASGGTEKEHLYWQQDNHQNCITVSSDGTHLIMAPCGNEGDAVLASQRWAGKGSAVPGDDPLPICSGNGTILPGGDTCYNGCDTGWDGADPCCCCHCCSKPPPQYKCVHDTCVATPTGGINKKTCEAVCG
jgi:hypothetical protein